MSSAPCRRLSAPVRLARLLACGIFALPLLWTVSASLRRAGLPPPRGVEWLPAELDPGNYARIFELVPLGRFLWSSALLVGGAVPLTLLSASWAGFAMSQARPRARRLLIAVTLLLLLVPLQALWLPRFVLLSWLGLADSVWALLLPACMGSSPLFVLLFYLAFRRVPAELFEAAALDGAGALGIWARVALPLARTATLTVAMLSFVLYWNDFMGPLLYLRSEQHYTLPLGLRMLQQLDPTGWPLLMAGAVVMIVPVLLLFLALQRYLWPEGWEA